MFIWSPHCEQISAVLSSVRTLLSSPYFSFTLLSFFLLSSPLHTYSPLVSTPLFFSPLLSSSFLISLIPFYALLSSRLLSSHRILSLLLFFPLLLAPLLSSVGGAFCILRRLRRSVFPPHELDDSCAKGRSNFIADSVYFVEFSLGSLWAT